MPNLPSRNAKPAGVYYPLARLVRSLGSLQLAVVLLAVLSVALILATLAEKYHGRAYALWHYYQSPWFIALAGVLSLNILLSMLLRLPWGLHRAGFVVTHVGLLTLLAGAAATYLWGIEGTMRIQEGQTRSSVVLLGRNRARPAPDLPPEGDRVAAPPNDQWPLDFGLKLIRFERTENPGGMGDAGYASTVHVLRDGKPVQEAVISPNRPLRFDRYVFYQSDYDEKGRRPATILSVSKDPGRGLKYAGSIVLCVGMAIVMIQQGSRMSRRTGHPSKEG